MNATDNQQVYIHLADDDTSFLCTVKYASFTLASQGSPALEVSDEPQPEEEQPMTIPPATVPCSFGDLASQLEKDRWLSKFAGVLHESSPASEHARR